MSRLQRIIQKTRELLHVEEARERPVSKAPAKPKPKVIKRPATPHAEGIDYSFGNGVTAQEIYRAGKRFVCRYLAEEGNPKDISKKELDNLLKAGLAVILVWETTADRMRGGTTAGANDAKRADSAVVKLGLHGIPIYFACDFDATETDQLLINAYLGGVAGTIGRSRVGIYGSFYVVKRAFDAKKIVYGWQTYAWSGGNWEKRAQLQQYKNGVRLGPAEVDLNRALVADYGQWPRP